MGWNGKIWPVLAACAVLASYGCGLAGPFILDDHVNLAPVWRWWSGQTTFTDLFSNPSGPLGRPLALLSFALNARVGGMDPFGFKLVNLLLHLGNALLVWRIARHLLPQESAGRAASGKLALWLALAWALHPQLLSSVLYVVQRMALLGALAQFAAVLVYLDARARLAVDPRGARLRLFAIFPTLVVLGLLGKETAALAPLLCAALEYARPTPGPRPREVRRFFLLFLALPTLAAIALLALQPARLLGGYDGREFDLVQRLLTEPRVMWDYVIGWALPLPAQLALYRDGYPLSHGWLQPPATVWAVTTGLLVSLAALALRRPMPLFAAGIAWFFAAHLMESTFLPLEPYFEHRNYVASLGLMLAAVGLVHSLLSGTRPLVLRSAGMAVLLALGMLTTWRAWHWSDIDRLLASEGPPQGEVSRRLQVDRAIRAAEQGDIAARNAALDLLAGSGPGNASAAALWRTVFACDGARHVTPSMLAELRSRQPPVLTHSHMSWLGLLVRRSQAAHCTGLDRDEMLIIIDGWEHAGPSALSPYARRQLQQMRDQLR